MDMFTTDLRLVYLELILWQLLLLPVVVRKWMSSLLVEVEVVDLTVVVEEVLVHLDHLPSMLYLELIL